MTYSYLPTHVLLNKIAVLNKFTRNQLPGSALLSQDKVLTIKFHEKWFGYFDVYESFWYATKLVDAFIIQVLPIQWFSYYPDKFLKFVFDMVNCKND
jgi:hypothetical protein